MAGTMAEDPADDPLDAIMQVMEAAFDPAFGESWTRRQVADMLLFPRTHHLLAPAPQGAAGLPRYCGFALSRQAGDEEELLLIAVIPEARNLGLGAGMLRRFMAEAHERGSRRLFLEMRDGNPAVRLYQRLGFEAIGRRPKYYRKASGGPVDAITFSLAF